MQRPQLNIADDDLEMVAAWEAVKRHLRGRTLRGKDAEFLRILVLDRAAHIREKDAKGTTMRELLGRVNALVELMEEQHGVTLGVTVRPPRDADYEGCDNAPE